jgi:putative nucleotidyltransferase with HDIG domain
MVSDVRLGARWEARRWQSRTVRALATVTPIAAATCTTIVLGQMLPRREGVAGAALWWVTLALATTASLVLVERIARRLLPLASLLQLTLVFPDRAPSRFALAMRSGSLTRLRRVVDETREHGLPSEPQRAAEAVLQLAAALSRHDRLTRGHCERVRAYADLIAEEMRLTSDQCERLRWAALLHDVGKLVVPAELLNKRGRPTSGEWDVIRRHPLAGAEICEPLRPWLGDALDAVSQHHERIDGTGYPLRLGGSEIGWAARVVAVADAYDVMTSVRSYCRPRPAAEARAELLRCAGTQFDPAVVRAFLNVSIGRVHRLAGPLTTLINVPLVGPVAAGASTASPAVLVVGACAVVAPAIVSPLAMVEAVSVPQVEGASTVRLPDTWRGTTTTTMVVVPEALGEVASDAGVSIVAEQSAPTTSVTSALPEAPTSIASPIAPVAPEPTMTEPPTTIVAPTTTSLAPTTTSTASTNRGHGNAWAGSGNSGRGRSHDDAADDDDADGDDDDDADGDDD